MIFFLTTVRFRVSEIALLVWSLSWGWGASASLAQPTPAASPATDRPNVVFILADDLGWGELGCYGQTKIPTPNLDQLARDGLRFTQHYSGAPVCAPSRCVLMTGQHTGHCLIRGNRQANKSLPEFTEGQHPIEEGTWTLAKAFREAGYRTGAMGKWGLGPVGSTGDPNRQGFETFVGYNCQALAHSFYPAYLWRNSEKLPLNSPPVAPQQKRPTGAFVMEEFQGTTYAPHVIVQAAEEFLDQNHRDPFFLFLPFTEPHVAMHPPVESVNRFPAEWDDIPYRGESGYLPHPRPRAAYAAMISDLDSYVGRILKKLDDHGLRENTLVIFTSDNGTTHAGQGPSHFHVGGCDAEFFQSTAGLRGYKGSVYEGGVRVPLIVRWPGQVPAGETSPVVGHFADWFPTLAELCQLKQPAKVDGESLANALRGQPTPPRKRPLVWVFPEYGGQVAVRLGDFKILHRDITAPLRRSTWEVYDLSQDPGETLNLAEQFPEWVTAAREVLEAEVDDNPLFPVPLPAVKHEPRESPAVPRPQKRPGVSRIKVRVYEAVKSASQGSLRWQ